MNLKKTLSVIIALAMIIGTMGFTVFAAELTASTAGEFTTALTNAQPGDTIKLTADIVNLEATVSKDITIDLGGKTVTDAYIIIKNVVEIKNGKIVNTTEPYPLVVQNGGELTVNNLEIEASKSDRAIWVREDSALNFESGSILATIGENNGNSTIYGIFVNKGSTVNIEGGTITVDAGSNGTAVAIYGNYDNTVNMSGGRLSTSGKTYSYGIRTDGNVTLSGGEIVTNEKQYSWESGVTYGKNYAIYTKKDVTITGGTVTTYGPSGYLVYAGSSGQTINISGVTFESVLTDLDKSKGNSEPSIVYASNAAVTVSSGTFIGVDEASIVNGSGNDVNKDGGTYNPVYPVTIGSTGYGSLAEAITAANAMTGEVTVEISGKTEYTASTANLTGAYDTINFVGKSDDAEICITRNGEGGYLQASKNVTFTDLILSKETCKWASNAGHMNCYFSIQGGIQEYTNCKFPNGACVDVATATYTGCEFYNTNSETKYSLWVYDDADVTLDTCEFTGRRAVKMYEEGKENGFGNSITVKNTDFSQTTDSKPAIVLAHGESVTLVGNTYKSTGVFELDAADDAHPNGTTVTADITDIACMNDNYADCGVLVDGKIYVTVTEAAAVATAGSTVTLMYNTDEEVELAEGVILNTNSYTAPNVTVAQPAPVYKAKIGEAGYESVSAALTAAQTAGMTDVTITLCGETTSSNTDMIYLYNTTVFDSITFKQEDPTKTYYIMGMYPGKRTNGGNVIFDGVNIFSGQYIFECPVVFKNNSKFVTNVEPSYFLNGAEIEAGSTVSSWTEHLWSYPFVVDGGKTDGQYNTTPSYAPINLYVNYGATLELKNGAYVRATNWEFAVIKIGDMSPATVVVNDSKLEGCTSLSIGSGSELKVNTGGYVTVNSVTGSGKITVDATEFDGESIQVIKANMSGFTGTVEIVGNDAVTYEITSTGLLITEIPEEKWSTDTDAGYYLVGETKTGMMRFLFAFKDEDVEIKNSGIKYLKSSNITDFVASQEDTSGEKAAFYGDITGIKEAEYTDTYYAVAYVETTDGKWYWSESVGCTPNFDNYFKNYPVEVAE